MKRLLSCLLCFAVLWASQVQILRAAIAYVQSASTNGSAVTITGVTAGSLLVWCGSAGGDVTALTDDRGDTWTEVPNAQSHGTPLEGAMWYAKNATSGTHVVTRTGGFTNFESSSIAEYSGLDTTAPLDVYAGSQNTASVDDTPSSGSTATTAQADELLVGCLSAYNAADYSDNWSGSFTNRGRQTSNSGTRDITWADRIVSATGTYEALTTADGSGGVWQMMIATYKMASGAAGPDPLAGQLSRQGAGR